ncbi:hypothetical protein [Modicisalibacter sp. 'Wilcox']|uniref:hypothetical protein n=1 Tax=Modicisalibacter sp. 'Wilcox' TaxID=2679914 RepID=UPI0013D4EE74|nr:hypothetical protein [Modicisalibacter sp. 'Wilcox']
MTDYTAIQDALLKSEETKQAYWRELDKVAIGLRQAFESHLGVEKNSTWFDPDSKQQFRYVELGYWDQEAASYQKPEFIKYKNGDVIPGSEKTLEFVIKLSIDSPVNPNHKTIVHIDFKLKKEASGYNVEYTISGETSRETLEKSSLEEGLSRVSENLSQGIIDALDASEYE